MTEPASHGERRTTTCLRNGYLFEEGGLSRAAVHLDIEDGVGQSHTSDQHCGAVRTLDLAGGIVVPEVIDAHVHVLDGFGIGAPPDRAGRERGVGTIIDAGSAGAVTLPAMRRIATRATTRTLLWLNVSAIGLVDGRVREAADPELVDPAEILDAAESARELVVGFKARLNRKAVGDQTDRVLAVLGILRGETGLPATVHVGDTAEPLDSILGRLEPGDVVCHAFHGFRNGIIERGRVAPYVREAADRGILFDIAPGNRHLSLDVLRTSVHQGFPPDLITTDVSGGDIDAYGSRLDAVASVVLDAGTPLEGVLAAISETPAVIADRARRQRPDRASSFPAVIRRKDARRKFVVGGERLSTGGSLEIQPLTELVRLSDGGEKAE